MCNAAWNGRQKLALGGKRCFTRSRWLRQTNDSRSYCAVGVIGLFCQIGNRLTAGGGGTSTAVNLAGAIVSVPVMARFTIVSCSSRRSVGRRVKTCILLRDQLCIHFITHNEYTCCQRDTVSRVRSTQLKPASKTLGVQLSTEKAGLQDPYDIVLCQIQTIKKWLFF